MTEPVDRLTEKQRECLRLVWRHYESKQIARELGIKPDAVDGRIKTATRTLGALDRYEAARILVQAEAGADSRSIVYPPSDVPNDYPLPDASVSFEVGERQPERLAIEEVQAPYRLAGPTSTGQFSLPLPAIGRETNDLSSTKRLFWIIAIAIGTALAFGALADGLKALSRFV